MSDTVPESTPAAGRSAAAPARATAFGPLLISLLALLAYFGAQLVDAFGARDALQKLHAGQQQTVDSAAKLRASLDALAADTQRLANAGNGSAALLVEERRKRGVTITVPAPGAAPAASAPK
ncbi:MAG: hypothetical protein IT480_13455 [Gammaproteobacteria bacterium]|nr:hypothetical protein [Gammaproteobacteria bacterium]